MVAPLKTFRERSIVASTVHMQRRIHLPPREEGMSGSMHALEIIKKLQNSGYKVNSDYCIDPAGMTPLTFMLVIAHFTTVGAYPLIYTENGAGLYLDAHQSNTYNIDQVAFVGRGYKWTVSPQIEELTVVLPVSGGFDLAGWEQWTQHHFPNAQTIFMDLMGRGYLQDRVVEALAATERKTYVNNLLLITPAEDEHTSIASVMLLIGLLEKVTYMRMPFLLDENGIVVDTLPILEYIRSQT